MPVTTRGGQRGKVCTRCAKWKALTEYEPDARQPENQGFRSPRCNECKARMAEAKRKRQKEAAAMLPFLFS